LGLSVCYDIRFPETYIELVKQGAEILLVPSAFTVPTGKAHWHTLLNGKMKRDKIEFTKRMKSTTHKDTKRDTLYKIINSSL
jgi:Carbon-nitrogen hydrolase